MVEIDLEKTSQKDAYKLLIGAIVPRPIAWVSTIGKNGITNVAPFSFFTGVSSAPPALMFSVTANPDGSEKDTLRNCKETKEFVVNIVSEELAKPMNDSASQFPPNVSEIDQLKIKTLPSTKIKAPRVAVSPIQMECKVLQIVPIGQGIGSGNVIIGQVIQFHVKDSVLINGRISLKDLKPIARLAGSSYAKVTETFELERPTKS
ncbi:MAG: flavin reductase family protein [Bacteriovoracia bacterium]